MIGKRVYDVSAHWRAEITTISGEDYILERGDGIVYPTYRYEPPLRWEVVDGVLHIPLRVPMYIARWLQKHWQADRIEREAE